MAPRYAPETCMIPGRAGRLEASVAAPEGTPHRIALVAHPQPMKGGAMTNKVVQTLCKTFHGLGYLAATVNFRGVGASEGTHDFGIGEADDMAALAAHARSVAGDLPVTLAGFSFGGGVQARASHVLDAERLFLVAPSISGDIPPVKAETFVLCAFDDNVVVPDRVIEWSRKNGASLTAVPEGGHFFHRRLHLVSDWVRAQAPATNAGR